MIRRRHNPQNLINATFPAGTVSGSPKIRAMQISAELEGTGGDSSHLLLLSGFQRRIIQVEAVEDLIVVVARRGMRMVGEGLGVGALEEQHG